MIDSLDLIESLNVTAKVEAEMISLVGAPTHDSCVK